MVSEALMEREKWLEFLKSWSEETLSVVPTEGDPFGWSNLPTKPVADNNYLGYQGASEDALAEAEKRLGVELPPSFRHFLLASDGARIPSSTINRFFSAAELEWFVEKYED